MQNSPTPFLKHHLQKYGALSPASWQKIEAQLQVKELKPNQNFIHKEGTFAIVVQGILQEYDAADRCTPAIVNFIARNNPLITRRYNQHHHLKACLTTVVFYLEFEKLLALFLEFKELKEIYDSLCAQYDSSIAFRQLILEAPTSTMRITLFRERYHELIPYLKKKDIANYLQLNYNHFLHVNSNLG